ncbi:MAG TPA: ATP-binding cassette domain-containing protein [Verrucomicrobiae bacterium]|jgi:ABC-type transporter Mla maintaining outer membrane lipid asymmetry ATPase subunit MlaF|nr:ATP-binding cassette domain-containing protein [Verrucomicrobiae bacterium]
MEEEKPWTGPLAEAEGAAICYGGHPSQLRLSGLDWKIAAGSYWVVGGPPDSGKTDLLATMAGLQRPAGGVVRIFGRDVTELGEPDLLKLRTKVGFVFKGGGRMFSDLTVAENIALPLRYHQNLDADHALDTVHALLDLTDLGNIGPERPQRLGMSQQQRVGLARALALKPDALFLDEPLAGLGWRHRQWWLDFLQELSSGAAFMDRKKLAVVVTTNDFAPWSGRRVEYAVIRDQRWQMLGEQKEPPNV